MNEELRAAGDFARDPNSVSWVTYVVMGGLAVWGGIVRVFREVALSDKTWRQIAFIFAAESATSSFAGIMMFLVCQSNHVDQMYTAALTGISGYMGGRAISMFGQAFRITVQAWFASLAGAADVTKEKPHDDP